MAVTVTGTESALAEREVELPPTQTTGGEPMHQHRRLVDFVAEYQRLLNRRELDRLPHAPLSPSSNRGL